MTSCAPGARDATAGVSGCRRGAAPSRTTPFCGARTAEGLLHLDADAARVGGAALVADGAAEEGQVGALHGRLAQRPARQLLVHLQPCTPPPPPRRAREAPRRAPPLRNSGSTRRGARTGDDDVLPGVELLREGAVALGGHEDGLADDALPVAEDVRPARAREDEDVVAPLRPVPVREVVADLLHRAQEPPASPRAARNPARHAHTDRTITTRAAPTTKPRARTGWWCPGPACRSSWSPPTACTRRTAARRRSPPAAARRARHTPRPRAAPRRAALRTSSGSMVRTGWCSSRSWMKISVPYWSLTQRGYSFFSCRRPSKQQQEQQQQQQQSQQPQASAAAAAAAAAMRAAVSAERTRALNSEGRLPSVGGRAAAASGSASGACCLKPRASTAPPPPPLPPAARRRRRRRPTTTPTTTTKACPARASAASSCAPRLAAARTAPAVPPPFAGAATCEGRARARGALRARRRRR
eukprot:scaffold157_cov255-Prasinococcus_capsulatus_cf.AAC.3